jgi:hypothetical protein
VTAGQFTPDVKATVDRRALFQCEVCEFGAIAEYHHRRARGMGGSSRGDTGSAANCLGLCHTCHRMIESNRRVAILMGWLVPQGISPVDRRVLYRGDWRYLDSDGTLLNEDGDHVC